MKNQKSVTVALILSLMSFIIEAERKLVPHVLDAFHVELSLDNAIRMENPVMPQSSFCSLESSEEVNQIAI